MSDLPLSDIDFENKRAWVTIKTDPKYEILKISAYEIFENLRKEILNLR